MSLASVRTELATALDAVDGINAYDKTPSVIDVGTAMPLLGGMTAGPAFGLFEVTWSVRVVCGRTPQDAIPFLDAHLAPILEALAPHGYVESIDPAVLTTASGDLHGVIIRLIREP